MDFGLNEEQRAFQKALRSFVDKEIMPVAIEWEHSGRYPTEIVDHMKDGFSCNEFASNPL